VANVFPPRRVPPSVPSIEITAEQRERLDALRERLGDAHAGEYASVRPVDAMEYLLDLADETDDLAPGDAASAAGDAASPAAEGDDAGSEAEAEADADEEGADDEAADDGGGASPAGGGGILDILGNHDDKWREADGEERYEVDLPDGGVETARTRDDVKAILFEHYR